MGFELERWASRRDGLSLGDYRCLLAMCQVAHDATGQFFLHPQKFLNQYQDVHRLPSSNAFNKRKARLIRMGFIGRVRNGNGRWDREKRENPPKGSAPLYQILAYEVLPAKAFEKYEEAVRGRAYKAPPRAQGRLSLESQAEPPRRLSLESQAEPPRRLSLESQAEPPRRLSLDPGKATQKARPRVHDDHVIDDQPPTTRNGGGGRKDDDLDRTLKRLIKACQVFGAIQGLTPSDLDRVRAKLIETGRQLTGEDCAYIAEETLRALPREAWRTPERIKGMLNKKMADLIQGVHIDAEQAYKILGRLA